jgi:hypothetical protein
VHPGVRAIGAVADDRRGSAVRRREDATVGGAVDALREARDDGDAGVGEGSAERERGVPTALRGVAGANDPSAAALQHGEIAAHEQHGRRLRIDAQRGREGRVARREGDDADRSTRTGPPRRVPTRRRRPPRTDDGRPHHRRDRRCRRGTTGSDREGLVGLVVRQQRVQAGHGHEVEAGQRGERAGGVGGGRHHATNPGVVERIRVRSDSATSTSATSMSVVSAGPPERTWRRSAIVRATRRTRW